jgi:hypothetical protein
MFLDLITFEFFNFIFNVGMVRLLFVFIFAVAVWSYNFVDSHVENLSNDWFNNYYTYISQNKEIKNVARSVWLCLFMDSTGKCRLPSTFQYLIRKWWNFEFRNIRRCVYTAVITEPSMWHSSAIPWKAAYGPQVK